MATWVLAAGQAQEPGEGASGSVSGVGNGNREGALCPAEPPSPLSCSSLLSLSPNGFFWGVPVWLTLGAVFSDLRFSRSPTRSPSPVPPCRSQQGRGSRGRARGGVSFPTHAALTPICSVCLIQPLCPPSLSLPRCPPQCSPSHFTALLSLFIRWFAVWIVGFGSLLRPFAAPCRVLTGFHRVLSNRLLRV